MFEKSIESMVANLFIGVLQQGKLVMSDLLAVLKDTLAAGQVVSEVTEPLHGRRDTTDN